LQKQKATVSNDQHQGAVSKQQQRFETNNKQLFLSNSSGFKRTAISSGF